MDTSQIHNSTTRAALEAWQAKDLSRWLSFFSADAVLFDDGAPRDLHKFSAEIGKERFVSIDKVENDGKDIYGRFHSDTWGEFRTYFKFSVDSQGRITRLEIGQAN